MVITPVNVIITTTFFTVLPTRYHARLASMALRQFACRSLGYTGYTFASTRHYTPISFHVVYATPNNVYARLNTPA